MKMIESPLEAGNRYNDPKLVVVHAMGEFLLDPHPIHASDFLEKLGLSAHILVDPAGDVYVCREDTEGAYHARGYNTNSLGIEFLVQGHHNYGSFLEAIKGDYVTDNQWESGVNVVKTWVDLFTIKQSKVVRHSDISPGRKVDPGSGFKWDKFLKEIRA